MNNVDVEYFPKFSEVPTFEKLDLEILKMYENLIKETDTTADEKTILANKVEPLFINVQSNHETPICSPILSEIETHSVDSLPNEENLFFEEFEGLRNFVSEPSLFVEDKRENSFVSLLKKTFSMRKSTDINQKNRKTQKKSESISSPSNDEPMSKSSNFIEFAIKNSNEKYDSFISPMSSPRKKGSTDFRSILIKKAERNYKSYTPSPKLSPRTLDQSLNSDSSENSPPQSLLLKKSISSINQLEMNKSNSPKSSRSKFQSSLEFGRLIQGSPKISSILHRQRRVRSPKTPKSMTPQNMSPQISPRKLKKNNVNLPQTNSLRNHKSNFFQQVKDKRIF
eukprot:gene7731-12201_t